MALAALAGCSRDVSLPPPRATADDAGSRAVSAQRTLDALQKALAQGDSGAAKALAAPRAADLLAAVAHNADELDVRRLRLDYIDASPGALSDSERQRLGTSAWVASVRVGYRLPVDATATTMEVAFTFAPGSDGHVDVAAIGGHDDRSPLWMRGPLSVLRAGRAVVLDAGGGRARNVLRLARTAVDQVDRVLHSWRGNLVVEVPADEEQLDSVLAADQKTYANIAAITSTVNGSLVAGAPVHVFLNPRVFGTLKTDGAQVVLTHESTHVAARAPFAQMPRWLLEGFADYVALAHAGVPVRVAAAQIIKRIGKRGVPDGLPTNDELSPTAGGLGATYEEAWLVCRYLATTYGERTLVSFYRAVDGGSPLDRAFRQVVGVSEREFVSGWRQSLAVLAG